VVSAVTGARPAAEFRQESCRPAVDIVFLDGPPHSFHPCLPFCRLHFDGVPNRIGELLDVVGVDYKGFRKLARGTGDEPWKAERRGEEPAIAVL